MKQIKYIVLLAVLTGVGSCRKNILDIKPVNLLTQDQIFGSPSGVTAYFASMYAQMAVEDYTFCNGYFGGFPGNGDQYTGNWTDEVFSSRNSGLSTNSGQEPYAVLFAALRNVNTFIQQVDKVTNIDPATKILYSAEARFIRAYDYFALVKYHGGVPLLLAPQEKPDPVKRAKETDIYDQIKTDLDYAAANLPDKSNYGRANKWVAWALEARAMLHAGSIGIFDNGQHTLPGGEVGIDPTKGMAYLQVAFDAANQVKNSPNYSLYNKYPGDLAKNFQYLFYDCKPGDVNTEAIFCKGYDYASTTRTHSQDLMVLPFAIQSAVGYSGRMQPTLDMVEKFDNIDGTPGLFGGTGTPNVPIHYPSQSAPFANKDPRFAGSIVAPGTIFRNSASTTEGTITGQRGVIYNGNIYRGTRTSQYFNTTSLSFGPTPTPYIGTGNSNGDNNGSNSQTFWLKKWTDPVSDITLLRDYSSRTSWLDMRLGEILLIYAEASFELGHPASEATAAINLLRTRAGMPVLATVDRNAIRHERFVELAFENRTYWDYIRWRTLTTDFSLRQEYGLEIFYDIDTQDYVFYKMPNGGPKTYQPQNYYFQIPAAERAANPLLNDNPGY